MDLKHKGIAWVGNFYQKFEAVCQEVDDIVKKDTVKYVENHVHVMGKNVKKFYSDVVQDLLPPLVEPVKREAQKGNSALSTYLKSVMGFEEDPEDTLIKQSPVEPDGSDLAKNKLTFSSSELGLVNEKAILFSDDSLLGSKLELFREKNYDDLDSDLKIQENANVKYSTEVSELVSCCEGKNIEGSPCHEFNDDNDKNEIGPLNEVSHYEEKHDEASRGSEFGDDSYKYEIGPLDEVPPATSIHAVPNKEATVSDSIASSNSPFSSGLPSFEVTCEKTIEDTGIISSCESLPKESCAFFGNSSENISNKVVLYDNPDDVTGLLSDGFSAKSVSSENAAVETGLASSNIASQSMQSLGQSASGVDETKICSESSENRHVEFSESINSEDVTASSDVDDSDGDILYSDMETIDLSDKLKLEESCVFADNSALYAVSRRVQRLHSYKKRILDAFASKKRLQKEYEQLAIWYGDTDLGPTGIPMDLKNSRTSHAGDSEWELL